MQSDQDDKSFGFVPVDGRGQAMDYSTVREEPAYSEPDTWSEEPACHFPDATSVLQKLNIKQLNDK